MGPNRQFGVFGSKTISHENFASFGLGSHRNRFSKKHVFSQNFFTKAHRTNYRGQTNYMARLGPKLLHSEVSYLRKNMFMVRIFLLNRPLTYFRGQTGCLVCLGAKLFRFISPRKPPKSFFQKTRFRSKFFSYSAPHKLSEPNGLYGTIGGKIVTRGKFRIAEKTRLWAEFFY